MKHKRSLALFVLALLVTSISLSACSNPSGSSSDESFWAILDMKQDDVSSLKLRYRDQDVALNQEQMDSLLQMLSESDPYKPENDHAYRPSDYSVVFVTAQGEKCVTFTWFEGRLAKGEQEDKIDEVSPALYELTDTRFDVEVEGVRYSFHAPNEGESARWNETLMRTVYDANAKAAGLKCRYQLDGFDLEKQEALKVYVPTEIPSLEDVLAEEHAQLIVLAQYVGRTAGDEVHYFGDDVFKVMEIYRGSETEVIRIHAATGILADDEAGTLIGFYQDTCAASFEEGKTYLLCLNEEWDGTFGLGMAQFSCAVLDDETLYPAYNTENHPFTGVALTEAAEKAKE